VRRAPAAVVLDCRSCARRMKYIVKFIAAIVPCVWGTLRPSRPRSGPKRSPGPLSGRLLAPQIQIAFFLAGVLMDTDLRIALSGTRVTVLVSVAGADVPGIGAVISAKVTLSNSAR
jgi:hypothetical protein